MLLNYFNHAQAQFETSHALANGYVLHVRANSEQILLECVQYSTIGQLQVNNRLHAIQQPTNQMCSCRSSVSNQNTAY